MAWSMKFSRKVTQHAVGLADAKFYGNLENLSVFGIFMAIWYICGHLSFGRFWFVKPRKTWLPCYGHLGLGIAD
jgi:hypothetical protein